MTLRFVKHLNASLCTVLTMFMTIDAQHEAAKSMLLKVQFQVFDLTCNPNIQLLSIHQIQNRLVALHRLPPIPCRCTYWFSGYWLRPFTPPPRLSASGVLRRVKGIAGLSSTFCNILIHPESGIQFYETKLLS